MARRGHGEGSISQRTDGRWQARISLGYDSKGKRIIKTVYGRSRKEVATRLAVLLKAQQDGLPPTRDDVTVEDLLKAWMEESVIPRLRETTVQFYKGVIKNQLLPHLAKKRLSALTARDIQAALNACQKAGVSPRTVAHARTVLKTALNQAIKWDWITRNVAEHTDPPRLTPKRPPQFSEETIITLLAALKGHRREAAFLVIIGMGLRRGEVLGLTWDNIDLTEGILTISQQLQQSKTGAIFSLVPPKSEHARRTLIMPLFVHEALLAHKATQDALKASWEECGIEHQWNLVFTDECGKPLTPRNFLRDLTKALASAGITDLSLHSLRHLCATLLTQQNVPPRIIMAILGHSDIRLLNIYSHATPEGMARAAGAINAALPIK